MDYKDEARAFVEEARDYWQSEINRIGPEWDTAEIMTTFAQKCVTEERRRVAERHAGDCRLARDGECAVCDFIEKLEADSNG